MSDAVRLLELIEAGLNAHGGDLGGWTRLDHAAGTLQVFGGRVTLSAMERQTDAGESAREGRVHIHALASLHDYDDEVLDACLMGFAKNREEALAQAAMIWVRSVAGSIRSFIDNRPVCSAVQIGVHDGDASKGYVSESAGFSGVRAFVGPAFGRGFATDDELGSMGLDLPWFRYAAEAASPRRVHIAKSILICNDSRWHRELEVDGHDASLKDSDWPREIAGPQIAYGARWAVFEFPVNSNVVAKRAQLDRAIRRFAELYATFDDVDALNDAMVNEGFDRELVHDVRNISTIAFGRIYFGHAGVRYAEKMILAHADGRVETDVPLLSHSAFTRGLSIGAQLQRSMPEPQFRALALFAGESQAILQCLEAASQGGKPLSEEYLSNLQLFPPIVPDADASEETMRDALAALQTMIEANRPTLRGEKRKPEQKRKPWWKFW